ncbi:MAG: hypothetical protein AUK16_01860 [Parcubacteria group bacterium CG2_30_44_11]|nr:MAG: hypothetical protein AUK16_01860 [Parcubacteria group bacterium CG2_30_44_11]
MNFWQQLPKPFFAVAPMADVTDVAFRRMIAKYSRHVRVDGSEGGPDVMWTEFVSADGLVRATPEGKEKLMADLLYAEEERPIVAQLFTRHSEHMEYAASLCLELGFDGIDINMGCPVGAIIDQGCGAAMIKTPELAIAIIRAAKRGAKTDEGGIPVSVKTRLGYNTDEVETWIPTLLKEKLAALTVHTRTRKDMSKVSACWERLLRIIELRDELAPETVIIGNGDVLSLDDAKLKAQKYGVNGVMIGRALFGNPWFFNPTLRLPTRLTMLPTHGVDINTIHTADISSASVRYVPLSERFKVLLEHTKLFEELLPHKSFATMKKHYKAYVNGFPGAAAVRAALMACDNTAEMELVIKAFLEKTD